MQPAKLQVYIYIYHISLDRLILLYIPYAPIPSASGFGLWVLGTKKHLLTWYLEH